MTSSSDEKIPVSFSTSSFRGVASEALKQPFCNFWWSFLCRQFCTSEISGLSCACMQDQKSLIFIIWKIQYWPCKVELWKDVSSQSVFQLFWGQILNILHSVLLCCIVDKNVDLSILFHNNINYLHTKLNEQEDLNCKP
jgi:hypothetical protein